MRRPGPRLLVDATLALAAVVGLITLATRDTPDAGFEVESRDPPAALDRVVAQVTGAVVSPGLVTLARGSRGVDALSGAGGALPDANLDAVNLARRIEDGDHIVVPKRGERFAGLLDLNRATRAQLISLAGIGDVTAGRIIDSRAASPFTSSDDLVTRRLLPATDYEAIRDLVTTAP